MPKLDVRITKMRIINIISDRKNITLNSDVILYIIMNGKIAEIHIVGGKVYQTRIALKDLEGLLKEDFVKVHRGCIVSVKAIHEVTDMVNLSNGEELPYTVRKKKQIVTEIQEKQKKMINALGKKGIPATKEEYCRHYSSFEYLPIAFTDIEMVFNEESHAVDWIFRYANQELAKLEKLSLDQLLGKSFGSLFANMDPKWLRSYERSALYGEVLELMDYSPEVDRNLKVICFPTFKGHCGCILFDLDTIKAVDSSNNIHKMWNTYLKNRTKQLKKYVVLSRLDVVLFHVY